MNEFDKETIYIKMLEEIANMNEFDKETIYIKMLEEIANKMCYITREFCITQNFNSPSFPYLSYIVVLFSIKKHNHFHNHSKLYLCF